MPSIVCDNDRPEYVFTPIAQQANRRYCRDHRPKGAKDAGATIPGYVFGKEGDAGVICVQEWWGVTHDILDQAAFIAKTQRYRVFVPDLYRGKLSMEKEEVR